MLTDFRSALMFITILPAGKNVAYSPVGMVKWFPVVGLLLGVLLGCFDVVVSRFWPPGTTAVLDVIFLVVVTGAFHLDGLGDTADGIFSHRPKERVLEIMKDSRSGMMGLVAVFCLLSLKIFAVMAMKDSVGTGFPVFLCFVMIPALARSSMIFGIHFMDYGRKDTGTGLDLFKAPMGPKDFIFILIPMAIGLFLGYKGLFLMVTFCLSTMLILKFYRSALGCITGDMLGAMSEVTEAVLLLAAGAVVF